MFPHFQTEITTSGQPSASVSSNSDHVTAVAPILASSVLRDDLKVHVPVGRQNPPAPPLPSTLVAPNPTGLRHVPIVLFFIISFHHTSPL